MNDYCENILNKATKDIANELFIKLSESKNCNDHEFFCVLEGASDMCFYSNLNHSFFKENKIKYLYGHFGDMAENVVGKEAVLKSSEYALEKFPKKVHKCVFIVDHDYFGLEEYKNRFSQLCLERITVLPVYSFENYFVIPENLEWIISSFLPLENYEMFWTSFNAFCNRLVVYCTYKAVITKHHIEIKYENLNCDDSIFYFDFHNGYDFNYSLMDREIENMSSFVSQYPSINRSVQYVERKLSDGRKFLKGKIMFNYVRFFLCHKIHCDILSNVSVEFSNIVQNLIVEFEINKY